MLGDWVCGRDGKCFSQIISHPERSPWRQIYYSISERVGLDWVLSEGPRRSHVLPGIRHDLLVEWKQILQFQGGQKAPSPSPVYLRGHPFLVKSLPAA